ncbi:uncharacterized protein EDB93DRAFT_728783 [Suillus bovinus]|uniref:uncharacterized protein n=1 Tax=Suillus bovinus TaxID=48563 RepID=UPI001B879A5B|nr:uncharacterized protein EDB93DRAFT_728783 [Suillus bovinus]KAG2138087.1 hypothetical protein EDB93DRAFT_728783 [Suillus bovinus]
MATTTDNAAQLIFAPNVLHNQALTSVKFLSSCFAGAVAGILGLENWLGFALFIASIVSTSFIICYKLQRETYEVPAWWTWGAGESWSRQHLYLFLYGHCFTESYMVRILGQTDR